MATYKQLAQQNRNLKELCETTARRLETKHVDNGDRKRIAAGIREHLEHLENIEMDIIEPRYGEDTIRRLALNDTTVHGFLTTFDKGYISWNLMLISIIKHLVAYTSGLQQQMQEQHECDTTPSIHSILAEAATGPEELERRVMSRSLPQNVDFAELERRLMLVLP